VKRVVQGQIQESQDGEEDVSNYWRILKKEGAMGFERESTRSQSLENLIWKHLQT
jgi:hypothetical protein